MTDLEREQLQVEREKNQQDTVLRREELDIRRAELAARVEDDQKKRVIRFSPAVTGAIIVAVISLFGSVATGILQVYSGLTLEKRKLESSITLERRRLESSIALEREKFESSLILKALEAKSKEKSAENLVFLVETGLLESRKEKLKKLAEQPEKVPIIEPIEARLARLEIQLAALECQAADRTFDLVSFTCTEVPLRH